MTKEEKDNKVVKKEALKKKLSEIQRKISLCVEMLSKARDCQTLLKTAYEDLDRELFEKDPGITVFKTRKNKTKEATAKIFTSYENMTPTDQEKALSRLLEIQATMTQKTQI